VQTLTRKCSKCGTEYPLNATFFQKNQTTHTGGDKYFRPECRNCSRTINQGKQKAFKLAGKPERPPIGTPCDYCGRTDHKLFFDHDHETLEHRGWLCDRCNKGFGMLGDTKDSLLKAIQYLDGKKFGEFN
jgi:hypothetical protein